MKSTSNTLQILTPLAKSYVAMSAAVLKLCSRRDEFRHNSLKLRPK
jgi:hypothetical protein